MNLIDFNILGMRNYCFRLHELINKGKERRWKWLYYIDNVFKLVGLVE